METARILLGIVCLAIVSSGWGAGSGGLTTPLFGTTHSMPSSRTVGRDLLFRHSLRGFSYPRNDVQARHNVLHIARAEVGIREATGHNDGKRVEEYLATVGLPKGHPYCAAFISWVFKKAGYDQPRTAWSPSLFPAKLLVKKAVPGNIFGVYFPILKRIAHCGFVSQVKGDWICTIEANTSLPGSREGDGVYARIRHFRTIRSYADWMKNGGAQ